VAVSAATRPATAEQEGQRVIHHTTRTKSLAANKAQLKATSVSEKHNHATHFYHVCDSTRYCLFTGVKDLNADDTLSKLADALNAIVPLTGKSGTGKEGSSNSVRDRSGKFSSKTSKKASSLQIIMTKRTEDSEVNEKSNHSISNETNMESNVSPATSLALDQSLLPTENELDDKMKIDEKEANEVNDDDIKCFVVPNEDSRSTWTLEEDLRLLDGIEAHGLGNWIDISEAVSNGIMGGSNKTAKKCMERYWDDYLGRYGHILPPFMKVDGKTIRTESLPIYKDIWSVDTDVYADDVEIGESVGRAEKYKIEVDCIKAQSTASPEQIQLIQKECERFGVNLPPRLEDVQSLPGSEFAGFMPRRNDFDVEWENTAEHILADMEFSRSDPDSERDLKLQVISIYNKKLDGRAKRKQFIADHQLLNQKKQKQDDLKRSRDERDLVQRLRLFSRFHTADEHEKFVEKVLETKRLRKEIAQLQSYRRMGIRSLAEAEMYELDKQRREFHRREQNKDKKNASETASSIESLWPEYSSSKADRIKRKRASDVTNETLSSNKNEISKKAESKSEEMEVDDGTSSITKSFDISNAPGLDLLCKKEIALCTKLGLMPRYYLEVKRELIRECLTHGFVEESNSTTIMKVDVEKRGSVIKFLLTSGWIKVK